MFDSIIAEANERFNLNGKADTLLSALLARMADESRGGLTGFTEKFHQIGLSDTISSWVNPGKNTDISDSQLESALGKDTLNDIADQSRVDYATAVSAIAFMIPRVIDALTPDGALPPEKDLLSKIGGLISGSSATSVTAEETFDRIGTAAVPALEAEKKPDGDVSKINASANPLVDRVNADIDRVEANLEGTGGNYKSDSPLAWILPLLLLGLLLILGYWFCSKAPAAAPVSEVNANQSVTNAANQ